jgi:hypothetical protein
MDFGASMAGPVPPLPSAGSRRRHGILAQARRGKHQVQIVVPITGSRQRENVTHGRTSHRGSSPCPEPRLHKPHSSTEDSFLG